jgi:hypothetical protein
MPIVSTEESLSLLADLETRLDAVWRALANDADAPRGEGSWKAASQALTEARDLLSGKLRWELTTGCRAPWLAMMAGGTNVGKSEIFNALARDEKALPDARSAQTKHPLAYVHRDDADALRSCLEGWRLRDYAGPEALNALPRPADPPTVFVLAHGDDRLRGLCLIDSPDVDSDIAHNRESALRLMRSVDAVVYVTLTEKYNDRLCVDFLRACALEGRQVHPIFNFASSSNAEAQRHFAHEVLPKTFEGTKMAAPQPRALPFFREHRHEALIEAVAPIRDALFAEAAERVERKRQLARRLGSLIAERLGSLRGLGDECGAWLRETEAEMERHREKAREILAARYGEMPFFELEELFYAVSRRLEVPYLDRGLAAVSEIAGKAAGMFGWRGRALAKTSELRRQRRDAEDAVGLELVGSSVERLDAVIDARPDHSMTALAKGRRRAGSLIPSRATIFPRTPADAEAEAQKLAEIQDALVDLIEKTPGARATLVGTRVAILSAAFAAIPVTGGMSVLTLLLGSAATAGANNLMIEGARRWVEGRKDDFYSFKATQAAEVLGQLHREALERLEPPLSPKSAQELANLAERLETLIADMTSEP